MRPFNRVQNVDLTLTESEAAFRDEVRSGWRPITRARRPRATTRRVRVSPRLAEEDARGRLGRALVARGVRRPRRDPDRAVDLQRGAGARQRPRPANVLGLVMGGPVVIAHGTEEQKERCLEPILSGEEIWCQGFSEPESGSDLASLKTTRREGQRRAGRSPVRRSGPPTRTRRSSACSSPAPTRTPRSTRASPTSSWTWSSTGVEVRPLRQITGEAEFNEIFLEEAEVPDENVVGGVGQRLDGRDHDADVRARRPRRRRRRWASSAPWTTCSPLIRERGLDDDPVIRQRSPSSRSVSRPCGWGPCARSPRR